MTARPPQERWPLRRLLSRLEIDQAVSFAIASRVWQFLAGPVTVLLIADFFSPEVQGYFYTFWSLIGLQMFFELSLPQVVLTVASHEWDKLALSRSGWIRGQRAARQRLGSLLRLTILWYTIGSSLFWVVVTGVGLSFFALDAESQHVSWQVPWVVLVTVTALTLMLAPFLALLEGCNQIRAIYGNQFLRAVVGNLVVWIAIPLGADLWVPAIASLVRMLCELVLLFRYRRFFYQLFGGGRSTESMGLDWKSEVWPFQWRVALKGIFGYFSMYFMVPLVFHFHGAVPAGQLGMTWQVLTSMQEASLAWVRTRLAQLGMLASSGKFVELDHLFFRITRISGGMLIAGSLVLWMLVVVLARVYPPLADRLVAPFPLALFLVALLFAHLSYCFWTYLHAHKRAPYLALSLVAPATTGLLVFLLGRSFGIVGVALAVLFANGLIKLLVATWVWFRCRQRWHGVTEPSAD